MGTTLSTADRTARHDKLQLEREKLDLEKRKFALEEEERRLALEERRATFTERVKYLTPPPTRTPTPVPVVRVGRKVSSLELTEELPGQPATHLAPRPLTPTPTAVRPPQNEFPLTQNVPVWTGTHDAKPLVFISYCWHNCSCDPREVASWITEADHNVWLDVEQLGHGKPLFEELVAALKKATVVIAFISDAYSQSENCQKEFFFAKELKLPLIPVIVGPPKLHDHPEEWKRSVIGFDLMNALYIDARKGSPMEIKGQILHTLNLKLPSPTMPSTVTTPGGTLSMIGAAEKGDLSLCAELLQRGNHVNQSDANGLTPLWVASKAGHVSVVKFLLSHGGDAKAMSNDEVSVLHAAATQAKSEIIDLLLKAGADPLAKNKGGQTPVWVAARHGFHDTVQILLTAAPESAMADAEGKTPLHVGAEGGHLRVLTRLIEHDPNVEVMDHTGATPLYLASLNGRLDTAWKLLFHNADFTTSNNAGRNPLHAAAGAGHLELCQLILSTTPLTESIIDWTDKQTFTPLYLASQQGHLDVVKYLLDRGALVDGTAGAWAGPLHIAVYEGHVSIARLLIEKGARVGYPNKMGYTPLMLAAQRGQTDLVRMLSEAGGDVNKVLDNGIGALYLAARFGFTETVELLIELDANIHAPTVAGKTALSRARELGHTEVVKVLEKHGAVVAYAGPPQQRIPISQAWSPNAPTPPPYIPAQGPSQQQPQSPIPQQYWTPDPNPGSHFQIGAPQQYWTPDPNPASHFQMGGGYWTPDPNPAIGAPPPTAPAQQSSPWVPNPASGFETQQPVGQGRGPKPNGRGPSTSQNPTDTASADATAGVVASLWTPDPRGDPPNAPTNALHIYSNDTVPAPVSATSVANTNTEARAGAAETQQPTDTTPWYPLNAADRTLVLGRNRLSQKPAVGPHADGDN